MRVTTNGWMAEPSMPSIPQVDIILDKDDDDEIEVRTYESAAGMLNFVVDINGVTVLRVGGLKRVISIVHEGI